MAKRNRGSLAPDRWLIWAQIIQFANAPHGRSFMSKDIFAYLAYRCGFKVLEQKEIDWEIKNLDCITLLQK